MTGKVILIGAGPGDAGLLTVRGKQLLQSAETVVYDALVGKALLALIPAQAEMIYVGKRAGNHAMTQEEINHLLLHLAQEGREVIRLHGGDPFLFGRGGEELELLAANDIPFEVVPGVVSAIAVPSYCGIPVTHREFCSSVHIITGHQKKGEPLQIAFPELAAMGGTLVFLMGLAALPAICDGLLQAGMPADLPAAVLSQGTGAGQTRVLATLGTLQQETEKKKPQTPAIIVVGEVCSLSENFDWYEKKPLFGLRVILTRPREQSGTMAGRLRELGAEVWELPTIATQVRTDLPQFRTLLENSRPGSFLVLTSPAGVRLFFEELRRQKTDLRLLAPFRIAVLGAGTRRALEERGLFAELMPQQYEAKALGELLAEEASDGDEILLPRAANGNPELTEAILRKKKVHIEEIPLYDTVYEKPAWAQLPECFQQQGASCVLSVFTSSSTVRGFTELLSDAQRRDIPAVCIGRQTQQAAQQAGMQTYVSRQATVDSLMETIQQVYLERRQKNGID